MSENKESDNENKPENEQENKSLRERTSIYEWIVAFIGLALVLFSVGYVAYDGLTSKNTPPNLIVNVTSVKRLAIGYLVQFKVKNEGEQTAANVVIKGKLSKNEREIETKTTTVDYVASNSEHTGGLFFTENPEENKLEINAVGYENP